MIARRFGKPVVSLAAAGATNEPGSRTARHGTDRSIISLRRLIGFFVVRLRFSVSCRSLQCSIGLTPAAAEVTFKHGRQD